jgi:hypothetical protein
MDVLDREHLGDRCDGMPRAELDYIIRPKLPKGDAGSRRTTPSSRKRKPGLTAVELLPDVFARYERNVDSR